MLVASLPTCDGINLSTRIRGFTCIAAETITDSLEAFVKQDNADSPQDPPLLPLFASRLKSQQEHNGEIQSVMCEQLYCAPKELLEFPNLYQKKSWEYCGNGY